MAAALGVARHVELDVDLSAFGGSSLTTDAAGPEGPALDDRGRYPVDLRSGAQHGVPGAGAGLGRSARRRRHLHRRQRARLLRLSRLSPEFIAAFERLASLAHARRRGGAFRIHTPLITLTKAEIIREASQLGLDYGLTHSCYDPRPDGRPCGTLRQLHAARCGFCRRQVSPTPLVLR